MENSPNWLELPRELTASILSRLDSFDILMSARKVCQPWRRICSDPAMWRIVDLTDARYLPPLKMEDVIKKVVDLSCGQLIELHLLILSSYGNMLPYICDRSSSLKYLHIYSPQITDGGLRELVITKLPMLEELHLKSSCNFKKVIEVAGRCCPNLKYLKLIATFCRYKNMGCDEDALAIAKNMPGLHHLQLFGPNRITRDGLLAITDSCPHLESLDVLLCRPKVGVELVGKLSQQIKHLRLSYNSEEDSDDEDDDWHPYGLHYISTDENDDLDSSDDDPYGLSSISTEDSVDEDDPSGILDINPIYGDYNHSYDYSDFFLGSDIDSD